MLIKAFKTNTVKKRHVIIKAKSNPITELDRP